jgi:multidrug transporter EmrE-like cation transporter
MMGYLYVFFTIILTVYGQIILKWRLNQLGDMPQQPFDKVVFLVGSLFDPYILSSFFSAFLASLFWMAALKEFQLSKAYPMMSLSFICVMFLSYYLFDEEMNLQKIAGTFLVVAGVIIISKAP